MSKEETLIWADNNMMFKIINKIINWIEVKIFRLPTWENNNE